MRWARETFWRGQERNLPEYQVHCKIVINGNSIMSIDVRRWKNILIFGKNSLADETNGSKTS